MTAQANFQGQAITLATEAKSYQLKYTLYPKHHKLHGLGTFNRILLTLL